jgi:hypothetical protein
MLARARGNQRIEQGPATRPHYGVLAYVAYVKCDILLFYRRISYKRVFSYAALASRYRPIHHPSSTSF